MMTLLTFVATSKTEGGDSSDDAEDVVRQNCVNLALSRVRLEKG